MKLIFCPSCEDVVRLTKASRTCGCRKSGGRYKSNGIHAEIWGNAVPLGIDNPTFIEALQRQPEDGRGVRFQAFVIAKKCNTVERRQY